MTLLIVIAVIIGCFIGWAIVIGLFEQFGR